MLNVAGLATKLILVTRAQHVYRNDHGSVIILTAGLVWKERILIYRRRHALY